MPQLCSFFPNYWQMLPTSPMKAHSVIPDDCTWSAFCPLPSESSEVKNSYWTRKAKSVLKHFNHEAKQDHSLFCLFTSLHYLFTFWRKQFIIPNIRLLLRYSATSLEMCCHNYQLTIQTSGFRCFCRVSLMLAAKFSCFKTGHSWTQLSTWPCPSMQ